MTTRQRSIVLSPPSSKDKTGNRRHDNFIGFRAYISFGNKEVYGPFTPSQGSPSHREVPSRHAEVHACEYARSVKRLCRGKPFPRNTVMFITRWSRDERDTSSSPKWTLQSGVPCAHCLKYLRANGVRQLYVSCTDSPTRLTRAHVAELQARSRVCTGVTYGK
jgi:hypothetical protein